MSGTACCPRAARAPGPATHSGCTDRTSPTNGASLRSRRSLLLDPHARALSRAEPLRSRVIDAAFDWEGDRPPATPWRDTVIYELHVKGYTQLHPAVPPSWRGKYLGLTARAGDRASEVASA